jgi:hypothetical protein
LKEQVEPGEEAGMKERLAAAVAAGFARELEGLAWLPAHRREQLLAAALGTAPAPEQVLSLLEAVVDAAEPGDG